MRLSKLSLALVLLTLIVVLPIMPAMAASPVTCTMDYTVQSGDRLQKIAETYYGDKSYYTGIVEATNAEAETDSSYHAIEDPSYVQAGWKLCLPEIDGISPHTGTVVTSGDAAVETAEAPAGLSMNDLGNMEYTTEWTDSGTAMLKDGKFEVEAAPGSASLIQIQLTDYVAYGVLDGTESAAVVMWSSGGGTGTFHDVAVVQVVGGKATHISSAPIEDRAQIQSIRIENNKIVIDMIGHSDSDPSCCATQKQIRTYELLSGKLAQASLEVTGTVSTEEEAGAEGAALTGVIWVWQSAVESGKDFTVIHPNGYRLEFLANATYRVTADCNAGSGAYTVTETKLTLQPGPMTRAMCGPSSQDTDYLSMLGQVTAYSREGDNLTLNLEAKGDKMVFTKLYAVTGKVMAGETTSTDEVINLPDGAVLEVKVTDMSKADAKAAQIGGILKAVSQLPVDFEAPYEAASIEAQNLYQLTFTVSDKGGKVLYRNTEAYPVITGDNPTYGVAAAVEKVK